MESMNNFSSISQSAFITTVNIFEKIFLKNFNKLDKLNKKIIKANNIKGEL
jgi:hypothetical protein